MRRYIATEMSSPEHSSRIPTWLAIPGVLAAGSALSAAGLLAQAWYAVKRPLPTLHGADCSGSDGPIDGPTVRVAALGDSSLTGPGLESTHDVWLRQATRRLAAQTGWHIAVESVAVGGSVIDEVLADQVPALADLSATDPVDIAVLATGPNDVIRVTPVSTYERRLRAVIRALQHHASAVVVGGVADLGTLPRLPSPLKEVASWRSRTLDRVTRAIAASERTRFVDLEPANAALHARGRELFCDDQFHCNPGGHALWARLAERPLAEAIREVRPDVVAEPA